MLLPAFGPAMGVRAALALALALGLAACGSDRDTPATLEDGAPRADRTEDAGTPADAGRAEDGAVGEGGAADAAGTADGAAEDAAADAAAGFDGGLDGPTDAGLQADATPCTPTTCTALAVTCGDYDDGCGATLDCGTCSSTKVCGGGGVAGKCGVFTCPATAGLTADQLLAAVPYGDYYCVESLAQALAPLATTAVVTSLLDIAASWSYGWSRRNAIRILGRFCEQPAGSAAATLVRTTLGATVRSVLLRRLEVDASDDVLADAIWVLDSFFFPYFPMQAALQAISADANHHTSIRFRAMGAIARLLYAKSGLLPTADVDFVLAALQSDDLWVRAEAAYICERFRNAQLTSATTQRVVAALEAAWAVETELTVQVYLARALDRFQGTTRLDDLRAAYEADHLPNTVTGTNIVLRSGLPAGELAPLLTRLENERAAFFDLLGPTFATPVAGDPNASVTVVVFATKDEYVEYMAGFIGYGSTAGGLYLEDSGTLYTFDRPPAPGGYTLEELLQHEHGHHLMGRYVFPGIWGDAGYHDQPKGWADEGTAEVLAGLTFGSGGSYTLVLRATHLAKLCGSTYHDLAWLLVQRAGYDEYGTWDYATGWSFVHYLLTARLQSGRDVLAAYRSSTYTVAGFAALAGVPSVAALSDDWHAALDGWCAGSARGGPPALLADAVAPGPGAGRPWVERVGRVVARPAPVTAWRAAAAAAAAVGAR